MVKKGENFESIGWKHLIWLIKLQEYWQLFFSDAIATSLII